jgi:CBS-domain-containing membrane protein
MSIKEIQKIIGVDSHGLGHTEKIISAVGGFIGIALTMWISLSYLGTQGAALLIASMGASAVLLFAVPHSPLTQPWPVIGGHTAAALIGVACAQWISIPLLAAPLSVALTIITMHYLRCLHPPGGGTALAAVVGGSEIHALGFQFVLTPVLLNATLILLSAIIVNYAFPWRRYPAYFKKSSAKDQTQKTETLAHADFEYAIKEIGSYIDIDEDDLSRIYKLALKHAHQITDQHEPIAVGNYYSNGEDGELRSVRKVIELSGDGQSGDMLVTYKIMDEKGQCATATATLADFTAWQQYEVILKNGTWHRIMQK